MNKPVAAGSEQPSYIGILGHRGSGKTCYLTALYHVAQATPETREILEDKHSDLYEKPGKNLLIIGEDNGTELLAAQGPYRIGVLR